ncbi:DUF1828 domain-containing protein [Sporolactobacillus sp. KGMB 08714]|uniref:DUF1828 domain-containing protein n=1 Tax=Sporolactobacillus sp. KGMB 08714 TaxID=3064704 RepID=UPI002FBED83E
MNNAQTLENEYLKWVKENIDFRNLSSSVIRIESPFLDRHNDHLLIYAIIDGNRIKLTDDSNTIQDLFMSGIDIDNSDKRKDILSSALGSYGITRMNDELTIECNIGNFAQAKHQLIQAILFVNDMFILRQSNIKELFIEDVDRYFIQNKIRRSKNMSISGKNGLQHKFDFIINGLPEDNIPDRYIKVLNDPRNNLLAKAILFDIQQTAEIKPTEKIHFYTFINDTEKPIGKQTANIITMMPESTIIPYSERDKFTEELSA